MTRVVPFGFCHCGCGQKTEIADRNTTCRGFVKGQPKRYLYGHRPVTPVEDMYDISPDGCWNWTSTIQKKGGYGTIARNGKKCILAHRFMYEKNVGPIPHGLHLDHLCKNRKCVNPAHLEPVTQAINNQRSAKTKLQESQVREIRDSYKSGASHSDLAERYGVSPANIWFITTGQTWVNVL